MSGSGREGKERKGKERKRERKCFGVVLRTTRNPDPQRLSIGFRNFRYRITRELTGKDIEDNVLEHHLISLNKPRSLEDLLAPFIHGRPSASARG